MWTVIIITTIFSTYGPLGHKFLYDLYRSTANKTKLKNKVSVHCVTHPCIYFENHFYFWFSHYLWLLLHNSDSNQFIWEIYENSLLDSDLIKFMLVLMYKLWHFSYAIFTFSSRFVLSFTPLHSMSSMTHIQICNITTYTLVQSIYFKFLYFHKTLR